MIAGLSEGVSKEGWVLRFLEVAGVPEWITPGAQVWSVAESWETGEVTCDHCHVIRKVGTPVWKPVLCTVSHVELNVYTARAVPRHEYQKEADVQIEIGIVESIDGLRHDVGLERVFQTEEEAEVCAKEILVQLEAQDEPGI